MNLNMYSMYIKHVLTHAHIHIYVKRLYCLIVSFYYITYITMETLYHVKLVYLYSA